MSADVDTASVQPGSYCTRCRAQIPIEDVAEYLADDYLCPFCRGVPDSEHAQATVAAQRGPTVRETTITKGGNGR